MCFFNSQRVTTANSIILKDWEQTLEGISYLNRDVVNGFDFGPTAVLWRSPGASSIELTTMEWGFLPDPMGWPFWETREQVKIGRVPHKDARGQFVDGLNFLNAVSEEVLLPRKLYRKAALERPCLFLSSGYYEWRHVFPLNKRTGEPRKTAVKYPYRIYLADREYFYIAGIWQTWVDAETGEMVNSCAMLTTAANALTAQIHNSKKRQPTVLTDELAWQWLMGDRTVENIQAIASFQLPPDTMRYDTLAKDFLNSVEPWKRVDYADLDDLV